MKLINENLDNETVKERLAQHPQYRQEALAQFILQTQYQANTMAKMLDHHQKCMIFGQTPPSIEQDLEYLEKSINNHAQKLLGIKLTED